MFTAEVATSSASASDILDPLRRQPESHLAGARSGQLLVDLLGSSPLRDLED